MGNKRDTSKKNQDSKDRKKKRRNRKGENRKKRRRNSKREDIVNKESGRRVGNLG